MDPTTQQIIGGGAVAVAIMTVLFKFKPWKNGNGRSHAAKSGELDPAEWEQRFGKLFDEKLEKHEPAIRQIIREELDRR